MITLVTGGARSGKSSFAESMFDGVSDLVYIATARIEDEEMRDRIRKHRNSRPLIWKTCEKNYNLTSIVCEGNNFILDCITVLSSNILFDMTKEKEFIDNLLEKEIEDRIFDEISQLISAVNEKGAKLAIVTNEIGNSIVPEHHISRVFRDIQGRINQRVAELATEAYLVVCGIPVKIK